MAFRSNASSLTQPNFCQEHKNKRQPPWSSQTTITHQSPAFAHGGARKNAIAGIGNPSGETTCQQRQRQNTNNAASGIPHRGCRRMKIRPLPLPESNPIKEISHANTARNPSTDQRDGFADWRLIKRAWPRHQLTHLILTPIPETTNQTSSATLCRQSLVDPTGNITKMARQTVSGRSPFPPHLSPYFSPGSAGRLQLKSEFHRQWRAPSPHNPVFGNRFRLPSARSNDSSPWW